MHLKHLQEMTQISEATGSGFFTEAKGYDNSGEFTDEFYDLFQQVTKMKKIMKNQKWIDYMKLTDFNVGGGTNTEQPARDAIKAVIALEKALNEIDAQMDKANGHSDDGGDEVVDDEDFSDMPADAPEPRGRK